MSGAGIVCGVRAKMVNVGAIDAAAAANFVSAENAEVVYPVGYTVTRAVPSYQKPGERATATAVIRNSGGRPSFEITVDDDPDTKFVSADSAGAWSDLAAHALAEMGDNKATKKAALATAKKEFGEIGAGDASWGLTHQGVAAQVRALPHYAEATTGEKGGGGGGAKKPANKKAAPKSKKDDDKKKAAAAAEKPKPKPKAKGKKADSAAATAAEGDDVDDDAPLIARIAAAPAAPAAPAGKKAAPAAGKKAAGGKKSVAAAPAAPKKKPGAKGKKAAASGAGDADDDDDDNVPLANRFGSAAAAAAPAPAPKGKKSAGGKKATGTAAAAPAASGARRARAEGDGAAAGGAAPENDAAAAPKPKRSSKAKTVQPTLDGMLVKGGQGGLRPSAATTAAAAAVAEAHTADVVDWASNPAVTGSNSHFAVADAAEFERLMHARYGAGGAGFGLGALSYVDQKRARQAFDAVWSRAIKPVVDRYNAALEEKLQSGGGAAAKKGAAAKAAVDDDGGDAADKKKPKGKKRELPSSTAFENLGEDGAKTDKISMDDILKSMDEILLPAHAAADNDDDDDARRTPVSDRLWGAGGNPFRRMRLPPGLSAPEQVLRNAQSLRTFLDHAWALTPEYVKFQLVYAIGGRTTPGAQERLLKPPADMSALFLAQESATPDALRIAQAELQAQQQQHQGISSVPTSPRRRGGAQADTDGEDGTAAVAASQPSSPAVKKQASAAALAASRSQSKGKKSSSRAAVADADDDDELPMFE